MYITLLYRSNKDHKGWVGTGVLEKTCLQAMPLEGVICTHKKEKANCSTNIIPRNVCCFLFFYWGGGGGGGGGTRSKICGQVLNLPHGCSSLLEMAY